MRRCVHTATANGGVCVAPRPRTYILRSIIATHESEDSIVINRHQAIAIAIVIDES